MTTKEELEEIAIKVINELVKVDRDDISVTVLKVKNCWTVEVSFYIEIGTQSKSNSVVFYDFAKKAFNDKLLEDTIRLINADYDTLVGFVG
jgi:hypothetical protein